MDQLKKKKKRMALLILDLRKQAQTNPSRLHGWLVATIELDYLVVQQHDQGLHSFQFSVLFHSTF
jgi:hypothetical protein